MQDRLCEVSKISLFKVLFEMRKTMIRESFLIQKLFYHCLDVSVINRTYFIGLNMFFSK